MTSDQELIDGCKKGKHSAYQALYTKYAKKMMAIALRYCNTNFEAEDIVQEAFIKVFEKINTFDTNGSFEGWLKRILVNIAINNYYSTKKGRDYEDSDFLEVEDGSLGAIFSKLSNDELLKMLNELPYGYRTVFNLYVIEGYNHKEIAEICTISEGTSKSQLAKSKVMLKEIVAKKFCAFDERERR